MQTIGPEARVTFHVFRNAMLCVLVIGGLAVAGSAAGETGQAAAEKAATGDANQPVELGIVAWGRDFDKAVAESKATGKPLMVLFDEVPGCGGCKAYGKILLSDPCDLRFMSRIRPFPEIPAMA